MSTPTAAVPQRSSEEQYEFTRSQEVIVGELARGIGTSSLVFFVLALMCLGLGTVILIDMGGPGFVALLPLVFYFCLGGALSFSAQRSLRTLTQTHAHDIDHLMVALQQLQRLYRLKLWAAAAAALLLFVLLLAPTAAG